MTKPTIAKNSSSNSTSISTTKPQIIFFGNGPLADYATPVLEKSCEIIFHARTKEDLETIKEFKAKNPNAYGVLASYGVIIKSDVLDLFEPDGILNIHPSLLPKYRGPSPIETAILSGDTTFGVSIMKLVKAMDAGPIYYQKSFDFPLTTPKDEIYRTLSEHAASWLADTLNSATSNSAPIQTPNSTPNPTSTSQPNSTKSPTPLSQITSVFAQDDDKATYTKKLDKSLSPLDPTKKTAQELLNQIRAFAGFPKSKYTFFDLECTIISAHIATPDETAPLSIKCHGGSTLVIDQLQPAGRKIMDAKSFINGYAK